MSIDAIVTSYIDITRTVLETSSPSTATAHILASTQLWFTISMAMVAIAIIAVLAMVISLGVIVCVINRKKKCNANESERNKIKMKYHILYNASVIMIVFSLASLSVLY